LHQHPGDGGCGQGNTDIVRGIKGHAEIGGFARWGIKVLQMSSEIGRKANLPVYVHFGQLWGLPKSGATAKTPTPSWSASFLSFAPAISWRIRSRGIPAASSPRGPGPRGDPGRAGARSESRRRPRQPFLVSLGPQALDAGIVPDTLGADMHGYNTHVPPPPGTPAEHADDEAKSVRRPGQIQPDPGDELDAGAGVDA